MKRIAILGAGISGLSAGWFLKQRWGNRIELKIYEKSERAGGWIQTIPAANFLLEAGPRGFRPSGKGLATLQLVKELAIEDQLLAADPSAKKRYLALNQKLVPVNASLLFKVGAPLAILRDLFSKKGSQSDETINDFITRRFGKKIAQTIFDPLTKGIYGGQIQKLSMKSCFPSLWRAEQEYGSVLRGLLSGGKKKEKSPAPLYSFKNGMATLTESLATKLKDSIIFGSQVLSFDAIDADCIVSALPSHALAPLLGCEDPFPALTLTLVHMGWNRPLLRKRGFGFLVPSQEKEPFIGMTWDSEIYARTHQTQLCVMLSGKNDNAKKIAHEAVSRYLGIDDPPDLVQVTCAEKAITQYELSHQEKVQLWKEKLPSHVHLLGTSFHGPGINDAIFAARFLAQQLSF